MPKVEILEPVYSVRIQAYYKSFKVEFDQSTTDMSMDEITAMIDALEAKGFKGTTFEKKPEAVDLNGKTGTVDKVEKSKTKTGKDCFLAHIIGIEGRDTPVSIMFFNAGECRKGDKVKLRMDNGYVKFDLIDEDGNAIPF